MDNWNWQQFAAAACVVWAAWSLVRRAWRVGERAGGCGGNPCQSCPSSTATKPDDAVRAKTFVPLSALKSPATGEEAPHK